jgi:hypothetical protein
LLNDLTTFSGSHSSEQSWRNHFRGVDEDSKQFGLECFPSHVFKSRAANTLRWIVLVSLTTILFKSFHSLSFL